MTWPQSGPAETEAAVAHHDRLRSSERLMAIMQRREEETRQAHGERRRQSLETLYQLAGEHDLPILVVRDGDRYDTDRATIVCWAEVVVYLAADFAPEPSWHPTIPGCYKIALHSEDGREPTVFGWHWNGTEHVRYERQALGGYIDDAVARVFTGNAERTNDRIARLAEQNRPGASRLADAVRAVARGDY